MTDQSFGDLGHGWVDDRTNTCWGPGRVVRCRSSPIRADRQDPALLGNAPDPGNLTLNRALENHVLGTEPEQRQGGVDLAGADPPHNIATAAHPTLDQDRLAVHLFGAIPGLWDRHARLSCRAHLLRLIEDGGLIGTTGQSVD